MDNFISLLASWVTLMMAALALLKLALKLRPPLTQTPPEREGKRRIKYQLVEAGIWPRNAFYRQYVHQYLNWVRRRSLTKRK